MNIPNKAYVIGVCDNWGMIYYWKYANPNDDRKARCKLPKWLVKQIKTEIDNAYNKGRIEAKEEIREALGL